MAERGALARSTAGLLILASLAVIFVVAAIASATGGVPESDVAKIDKVGPITKKEFNRWYVIVNNSQNAQQQQGKKKQKKQKPPKLDSPQGQALKMQVMQFLITADWIVGEAKERGITASDAEVRRQFRQTKKQSFQTEKQYQDFLKQSGQTQEDIFFRVRLEALSGKIRDQVTKGSTDISDSEIKNYYNDNKEQFSQPEQRDIQQVVAKTEAKAKEAKQALDNGDSFAAVVKKYSTDSASKSNQGKLQGLTKGTQDPALDEEIFKAEKSVIVGPVKTAQGYVVFKVTKIKKGTQQSLEQSKSGIQQLLVSQKQQKKLDVFQKTFRNKWRARTLCADDYVVPDCANGREDSGQQQAPVPPTPPGQPKPVPGSSGTNPPALDNPSGAGATSNLAGSGQGGPVLQPASAQPGLGGVPGQGGLPGGAGGGSDSTIPLALGGAPQKGQQTGLPQGLPQGLPGGAGGAAPPPGQ